MSKSFESTTSSPDNSAVHDSQDTGGISSNQLQLDQLQDRVEVYPYPVIPKSTRQTLQRSMEIADMAHANPDNSVEMKRRIKLDDVNHMIEVTRTYCRDELNTQAYEAAALGQVMDLYVGLGDQAKLSNDELIAKASRTQPDQRHKLGKIYNGRIRAGQALADFIRDTEPDNPHSREMVYRMGLLQDRERLNEFKQMTDTAETKDDLMAEPTREEWLTSPQMIDAKTMYDIVSNINIESILLSGAEMFQRISSHAANDRQTLDAIRYSEQIIAPIAEVIGFDSLAMSLNDMTKSLRLHFGGRPDLLIKADALQDRFRAIDRSDDLASNTESTVRNIIGQLFGVVDGLELRLPVGYNDINHSVYGDAHRTMYPVGGGQEVSASLRYRLKSRGSIAWKMWDGERHGQPTNQTSMDILGITLVTKNEDDLAKLFQYMATSLGSSANELVPYPSPSRTSPISVRGTDDFIARMVGPIGSLGEIDKKHADSRNELHLGKVMGFYGNLPFEIQCVTREYRDAMQTGQLAHIIYKNNTDGQMPDAEKLQISGLLDSIRKRRKRIGEPDLVGSSPVTANHPGAGRNTEAAHKLISDLLILDSTFNRTVGYVATNNPSKR